MWYLPGRLKTVFVKDHACVGPIEKLYYSYYSCGFEPICCYCATTDLDVSDDLINFPMCDECKEEGQQPIKRPKTKN